MTDARHHRATNVVLVIGSPETVRQTKPPRYPHQRREHWRGPPRRIGKAEALERLLRHIAENDRRAREMMRPDAAVEGLAAGGVIASHVRDREGPHLTAKAENISTIALQTLLA